MPANRSSFVGGSMLLAPFSEQPCHTRRHCMTHPILRQHPPLFHHLVLTRGVICHLRMPGCVTSQRRKCVPLIRHLLAFERTRFLLFLPSNLQGIVGAEG